MPSDPYAQYLTPPASSGGSDPYAKYLSPPGSGATAQVPSDNDYSNSPFSAAARTFAESAGLGGGDLLASHLLGTSLAHEQAKTEAASASLPWYVRYPLEAAGYGAGAGALLSGVPEALGVGGVGAMALEGGLAGGASSILHSDDPSLSGVLSGAAGGAVLGGAAGGLVKGVNPALKALGKSGTVDPVAAEAQTKAASDAAYAALHQKPVDPIVVAKPISTAMPKPNSSEDTGMSPAFRNQVGDIQTALENHYYQGTQPSLGDVNSWKRQINEAATTSVDGKIAGNMSAGLDGVMDATAPGLNQAAQTAAQNNIVAGKLGQWQQIVQNNGSIGQAPLTEATNWYSDPANKAKFDTLAALNGAGSGDRGLGYILPHMMGTGAAFAGEHLLGPAGAMAGEVLGYLGTKKLLKGYNKRQGVSDLQAAYPQLTGVQPVGGRQAPQMSDPQNQQIGEQLKNLMLGMSY